MKTYIEENRGKISQSKLKLFLNNSEEYYLKVIKEVEIKSEEKKHFIIGTALHDICGYGKEFFANKYFAQTENMLKADYQLELAKEGKDTEGTVKELEARLLNGRIKLTAGDTKNILGMYGELLRQPLSDMQGEYEKEVKIEVNYKGLLLTGRLDRFSKEKKLIRDFKTCANIEKLLKDLAWGENPYLFQVGFYSLLVKIAYGIDCECILDITDKTKNNCYLGLKFTKEQILAQTPIIIKALDDLIEENKKLENKEKSFRGVDGDLRNVTFSSEYYGIMECSIQKDFEYIETK